MIEKIARVLCESRNRDPDQLEPGDAYGIDGYLGNGDPAHCLWRQHVEEARAVLEAMREPNEAMASAGMHRLSELPDDAGWMTLAREGCQIWRAMIDAALTAQDS